MQPFLSCQVLESSAKKSCFIWLRGVGPMPFMCVALECFIAEFMSKKSSFQVPVSQELIFVAVEKREAGRASEFADIYIY
jgi:hypothetical protein